jgi:hypothetical protein
VRIDVFLRRRFSIGVLVTACLGLKDQAWLSPGYCGGRNVLSSCEQFGGAVAEGTRQKMLGFVSHWETAPKWAKLGRLVVASKPRWAVSAANGLVWIAL